MDGEESSVSCWHPVTVTIQCQLLLIIRYEQIIADHFLIPVLKLLNSIRAKSLYAKHVERTIVQAITAAIGNRV